MPHIGLVATDLDGTLIGASESESDFHEFRLLLERLRRERGTRWAIITGRLRGTMDEELFRFGVYGLHPDFLVLEDARIFRRHPRLGFVSFFWWNQSVGLRRLWGALRHRRVFGRIRRLLADEFPLGEDLSFRVTGVWARFPDLAMADLAEAGIRELMNGTAERFQFFRWPREMYVGPRVGTKGEALTRLCEHLHMPREFVFAVGDGANDISMLNGHAAAYPACVANAAEQVKATVRDAGGRIASAEGLRGVLESLGELVGDHTDDRTAP
jgi:hypothetical protein